METTSVARVKKTKRVRTKKVLEKGEKAVIAVWELKIKTANQRNPDKPRSKWGSRRGDKTQRPFPARGYRSSLRPRKDKLNREVRAFLGQTVTDYSLAAKPILDLLMGGLVIEKDTAGKVIRAELKIPCSSPKALGWAKDNLEPIFVEAIRREIVEDRIKKKEGREQSAKEKAAPIHTNAYHLIRISQGQKEGGPIQLHFTLVDTYSYIADQGEKSGQEVVGIDKLNPLFLQRVITVFLPELVEDVFVALKGGVAQEVAQVVASHLGLRIDDQQENIGQPDFDRCDGDELAQGWADLLEGFKLAGVDSGVELKPLKEVARRGRFAADDPKGHELAPAGEISQRFLKYKTEVKKLSPLFLGSSKDVVVYYRRDCGLYVSLPLPGGPKPRWWANRCLEFEPLPIWSGCYLTKRKKDRQVLPVSVTGGWRRLGRYRHDLSLPHHGRFVQAMSSGKWEVCWSRLVERDGDFFVQITTKRVVEPLSRPNLLGVHIAQEEVEHGHHLTFHCSLIKAGAEEGAVSNQFLISFDCLPHGRWPSRRERKRRLYNGARRLVVLASQLEADLAVEKVGGVKKRTLDQKANALATRFNYGDILKKIVAKAHGHPEPVRVWEVSDWCAREHRGEPHPLQADILAREGWDMRQRVGKKDKS